MSYFKLEEEKWDALPLGEKLAAWGLTLLGMIALIPVLAVLIPYRIIRR